MVDVSDIRLFLRPLEKMSSEERKEMQRLAVVGEGLITIESMASITKFLLSKHFDLFGLIEAGLAIDATTLK